MKGLPKISPEFLTKLKGVVNLIEVVGEHVVLKKSGSNHSGLCPFHSERTPSFSVSETKQFYYCYGCKKGGDIVSFVMEIHGLSFPEAIEELAARGNLPLPKDFTGGNANEDPEVAARRTAAREKQALAWKLNRFAAAFFHQGLSKSPHIEEYFRKRGVLGELARSFYVGAAPASWDALASHFVTKQAPVALAAELGLIKPSQKQGRPGGPGYFDLFRNRAMFPIVDMRGKVVAFGGRGLPLPVGAPEVGDGTPKYLNSSESFLFQKSRVVYGLYQAQKHIREKNEVIVVEGYFDVLGLHAAGYENVVATCGTALTTEHLQIFIRLCDRVTVLFDNDRAGIEATERAMELGLDHGLVLYGAQLPDKRDADEVLFSQETGEALPGGRETMNAVFAAAEPLLDARIRQAGLEAALGAEPQAQAVKQVAGWLKRFKDPVGRDVRIEAAASQLRVPRALLEKALGIVAAVPTRASSIPVQLQRPPAPKAPIRAKPMPPSDRVILMAMARSNENADILAQTRRNLPLEGAFADLFEHPGAQAFVKEVFMDPSGWERFKSAPETFMAGEVDPQVRSILTEAWVSSEPPYPDPEIRMALSRGLGRAWARFSHSLKSALAAAEAKKDAGLQAKLMKDYLDVQRKMKEFTVFYDEA